MSSLLVLREVILVIDTPVLEFVILVHKRLELDIYLLLGELGHHRFRQLVLPILFLLVKYQARGSTLSPISALFQRHLGTMFTTSSEETYAP